MSFLTCLFTVLCLLTWGSSESVVFGVLALAGVAVQARGWMR